MPNRPKSDAFATSDAMLDICMWRVREAARANGWPGGTVTELTDWVCDQLWAIKGQPFVRPKPSGQSRGKKAVTSDCDDLFKNFVDDGEN